MLKGSGWEFSFSSGMGTFLRFKYRASILYGWRLPVVSNSVILHTGPASGPPLATVVISSWAGPIAIGDRGEGSESFPGAAAAVVVVIAAGFWSTFSGWAGAAAVEASAEAAATVSVVAFLLDSGSSLEGLEPPWEGWAMLCIGTASLGCSRCDLSSVELLLLSLSTTEAAGADMTCPLYAGVQYQGAAPDELNGGCGVKLAQPD